MKTKKDPDLSHIRQTIDDLDYTINMMRGEIRAREDAAASIVAELKQSAYRRIPLSLFYGFLFGTGMYVAVAILENLV